ncbi:uncharacterized protein LOC111052834 isoform X1 [Nilaparvata lugens]|uniref:uncharacterized protein LOC111052834 isoform X1 n=2 Tax=Nilaparvata lugens TaxID=108931 RepID=UPI00193D5F57|nr:uncharacterized protein LOC111052834 isoform X1 [Nilaparvata lugens]
MVHLWRRVSMFLYKRKVVCGVFVAFVLYLMLRLKKYNVKFESVVRKAKPIDVWEYVADFSNMPKLNPTIVDFSIHEERGDYKTWVYEVSYTEFLSHLPFIYNYGKAEYEVKPANEEQFLINSKHRTCFFSSFACVNSWSTFKFEPEKGTETATHCTENVIFECPALFSFLCESEVLYQRRTIVSNLQKEFSKLPS